MEKTYFDFMNEISKDELYEGLLSYGFFSDKIPPVFSSQSFFDYCKTMPTPFSSGWNDFITFRVMRNVGIPRYMGIPTPMKYQRLCSIISDNWDAIREHLKTQTNGQEYRISRIHIRKEFGEKCLFKMNYTNWHVDGNPEADLLFINNGASRFLVKADISTCFPSIYTHSIPWALVGKENAKKVSRAKAWFNEIDKACSDMKNGETHGLLIGPHTSNILSELILTVVDKKLYDKGYRYIRNIDDYDCYVSSSEEANLFLRDLEECLREFDLLLNHKKTKIIKLPAEFEKEWKHQLSGFLVEEYGLVKYPQVNSFIDLALKLANENDNFAIVNYAIKILSKKKLSWNAKEIAKKRFMHMAVLYPYLTQLMEEYVFTPYKVKCKEIKLFSDVINLEARRVNDYESFLYSLYFALKYNFKLSFFEESYEEAIKYAIDSKDCLVLVFSWLYLMKQNNWNRKATQVKPLNKIALELKNSDMDRYWLFCYEALSYGSLSGEWRNMKIAGISFIRDSIKSL